MNSVKLRFLFVGLLWSALPVTAISQDPSNSFNLQLSYGYSFFSSNASPRYTIICPEIKIGLGYEKTWNRFGVSTGIIGGMRFGTQKNFAYQMYVQESKMYMLMLEWSYYGDSEFVEIPLSLFYQVIDDRLSIHGGLTGRYYFTTVPASNYPGDFEEIRIDKYNVGIISMLRFRVTRNINVSVDYSMGLKKLNASRSLTSRMEYYMKGSFGQFSVYINPRILKPKSF